MMRICITYHMTRENEIAETCIILPMDDCKGQDLLDKQEESLLLAEGATLDVLLHKLSILQGYRFSSFCMAEPASHHAR